MPEPPAKDCRKRPALDPHCTLFCLIEKPMKYTFKKTRFISFSFRPHYNSGKCPKNLIINLDGDFAFRVFEGAGATDPPHSIDFVFFGFGIFFGFLKYIVGFRNMCFGFLYYYRYGAPKRSQGPHPPHPPPPPVHIPYSIIIQN